MYYSNTGEKFVGGWKDDKRDGKGTLYNNKGKKKTGNWKEDTYQGGGGFFGLFG